MPENKEVVQAQLDESQIKEMSENVGQSVMSKVKEFFGTKDNDTKAREDFEAAVLAKAQELTGEAVQEQLNKIVPELKKSKQEELDTKAQELEAQKAEVQAKEEQTQLEQELELVDENYREYVKFAAEQAGKSVGDFIEESPQYKANKANVQSTHTGANGNYITLDNDEAAIAQSMRDAGII